MVAPGGLYALFFAAGSRTTRQHNNFSQRHQSRGATSSSSSSNGNRSTPSKKPIGRSRYAPGGGGGDGGGAGRGKRKRPRGGGADEKRHRQGRQSTNITSTGSVPLPPLTTTPGFRRPAYFTCRHTYEDALSEEILRQVVDYRGEEAANKLLVSSPHPGLLCLQYKEEEEEESQQYHGVTDLLPKDYNPTYALQSMPDCVIVKSESIKSLANSVMDALLLRRLENDDDKETQTITGAKTIEEVKQQSPLWSAPRGSLSIHALVPDMFRGVPEPRRKQRSYKIAEEIATQLKKTCAAARPPSTPRILGFDDGNSNNTKNQNNPEKWLLQVLLLEPEVAAASLTRCSHSVPNGHDMGLARTPSCSSRTWPNWSLPAGLAKVDIEQKMPSSAYRKLLEAFWLMGDRPPSFSRDASRASLPVVDLGACPGGWTGALRLMGCRTLSVDRSALDDALMNDPMVEFVKGDAFRYFPPWVSEYKETLSSPPNDSWMVSDLIAYPERVSGLLNDWCGKRWVSRVVITCKFQGKEIPWDELRNAEEVARGHGYSCLTKHFFNNKNEVTLMAVHDEKLVETSLNEATLLGEAMYPAVLVGGKRATQKKK